MKKIYTNPDLKVVMLNCDDIVTASETLSFGTTANREEGADAKRRTDIWGED